MHEEFQNGNLEKEFPLSLSSQHPMLFANNKITLVKVEPHTFIGRPPRFYNNKIGELVSKKPNYGGLREVRT